MKARDLILVALCLAGAILCGIAVAIDYRAPSGVSDSSSIGSRSNSKYRVMESPAEAGLSLTNRYCHVWLSYQSLTSFFA